ncbi:glycoside hydrolase [Thamnocephalis sphaerospora]|uniref:Glycoside hydrolase n=1 Tax=Thamnocephalis sphaerospora TaxID=78915 RepID=A0A4P9XHJ7_9FUNG|nr:glycoside hydrolase [Thamnocephalis sphaerospora]|eukprot:RKP05163.1 glycoside hydrolase [Thamnocephalis sphaerospora]
MYFPKSISLAISAVLALSASIASAAVVPGPINVGYYSDWTASSYPPSMIPFDKLTHVKYAFAVLDKNTYKLKLDTGNTLREVVRLARAKGVKVDLSVGGWTGSQYFSPMAATAATRAAFINSVVSFVNEYRLDGIDLDWEFPGRAGMACNVVNKNQDANNLLILLRELRQRLGSSKSISMAVRVQPFDGPNGPLSNVQAFAAQLDYIFIMAYDINGRWSATTGPNAPLQYSSKGGDKFSVIQSADAWSKAGVPASKIVIGVPFYGRAVTVAGVAPTAANMYVPIVKTQTQGDNNDVPSADICPGSVKELSGVWKWTNLRKQGIISSNYRVASRAWTQGWDNDSSTPWIYNAATKTFVSYDDPKSICLKARLARTKYGGTMVWALNQDNGELIKAIYTSTYSVC